jgi:hypothetical protein
MTDADARVAAEKLVEGWSKDTWLSPSHRAVQILAERIAAALAERDKEVERLRAQAAIDGLTAAGYSIVPTPQPAAPASARTEDVERVAEAVISGWETKFRCEWHPAARADMKARFIAALGREK